jgi:hypothetical protein
MTTGAQLTGTPAGLDRKQQWVESAAQFVTRRGASGSKGQEQTQIIIKAIGTPMPTAPASILTKSRNRPVPTRADIAWPHSVRPPPAVASAWSANVVVIASPPQGRGSSLNARRAAQEAATSSLRFTASMTRALDGV